jgi:methionyl aminopeptidase
VSGVVELKTAGELDAMRAAGQVVGQALEATHRAAGVGVSLLELDEVAREVLAKAGASSPFLGYQPHFATSPFPGVICVSVNDAIVHGIPTDYRLRTGDLVSVDCGATLDGWTGDAAVSFVVGPATAADQRLLDATRRALAAGIAAAVVGNRIGDIGHAIGAVADEARCGMPRDFGGHGIGRRMHEDPHLPNRGVPGRGLPLRPGLALAIEPMLIASGQDTYRTDPDGWTLRTVDGSRAAHFEHSVAVTADGPRILTLP